MDIKGVSWLSHTHSPGVGALWLLSSFRELQPAPQGWILEIFLVWNEQDLVRNGGVARETQGLWSWVTRVVRSATEIGKEN